MSTENISSNNEQMVSVPREWLNSVALLHMPLDELQDQAVGFLCEPCDEPATQHQGEPVAWMARAVDADGTTYRQCVSTNELTERDAKFAWGVGDLNRCAVVITPLYLHPPTSDGFSAGDMADQGAKAFRDGQQAAIPEGFALVPKEMLLSKEVIGVINFHCGDSAEEEGGQFGKYTDGRLWVGNVTDDDGSQVHGLHIMTDEYPEEGSTTLVEFPPPSSILPE